MRHEDPHLALKTYTHYEAGQHAEVARSMDSLWRTAAVDPGREGART
jgi:hypothetical protein